VIAKLIRPDIGNRQAEYTSVILHPVDGPLTEYLNTCVTILGNNQKRNAHFVMCIASAILVTGSVICFHFIFCSDYVFVYLTCVRCLSIFLVHAFQNILRLPLIVSYIELFIFILIFFVPHQNDVQM
jgi:hypothetical protein